MKYHVIILLLIFWLKPVHSQELGISLSGGIGSYQLNDLSSYQAELLPLLPVEVRQFDDFPPYTHLEASLLRSTGKRLTFGLLYAYSTTGTHANYRDYSGYLTMDQRLQVYQGGLLGSYRLLDKRFENSHIAVAANANVRMTFHRNNVVAEINTAYYYEANRVVAKGISPAVLIGGQGTWKKDNIELGLEGGYLVDGGTALSFDNESLNEPTIPLAPDREVRSNISGFRIGLKFILWFSPGGLQEQTLPAMPTVIRKT